MEEVVSIVKDCLNRLKRKNKVLTSDNESDKNDREVDGCTFIMIALWEAYDDSHHVERAIKTFVLGDMKKYREKEVLGCYGIMFRLWELILIGIISQSVLIFMVILHPESRVTKNIVITIKM